MSAPAQGVSLTPRVDAVCLPEGESIGLEALPGYLDRLSFLARTLECESALLMKVLWEALPVLEIAESNASGTDRHDFTQRVVLAIRDAIERVGGAK